jgi:hypothetical protein
MTKPPPPVSVRDSIPLPKPSIPSPTSSKSGRIQVPSRTTGPVLGRVLPPADASQSLLVTPPVPPVPRQTGAIPAPPPPRHTTSLPVPRRTGALPPAAPTTSGATPEAPQIPAPESGVDDLQRLAALAMAQMGETTELPTVTAPHHEAEPVAPVTPVAEPTPAPEPEHEPFIQAPEPVASVPVSEAEPEAVPEPVLEASHETVAETAHEPLSEAVPEPAPQPEPEPEPVVAEAPPVAAPQPFSIPRPSAPPLPVAEEAPPAAEAEEHVHAAPASVAFNLNTCTEEELVHNIHDCSPQLAASIIDHRTRIGSFKKIEELLDVPGMTPAAYTNLTGEAPPSSPLGVTLTLNELLGFPGQQHVSLKDVTDRIACWPDVTGCVLSQSSGLSLVGTVAPGVNKEAIVAFAPRMFESINKSFAEVSGQETDALVIPSTETSFHLLRNGDLYLIIMSRLPQMPERHLKVARFVLAALGARRE